MWDLFHGGGYVARWLGGPGGPSSALRCSVLALGPPRREAGTGPALPGSGQTVVTVRYIILKFFIGAG